MKKKYNKDFRPHGLSPQELTIEQQIKGLKGIKARETNTQEKLKLDDKIFKLTQQQKNMKMKKPIAIMSLEELILENLTDPTPYRETTIGYSAGNNTYYGSQKKENITFTIPTEVEQLKAIRASVKKGLEIEGKDREAYISIGNTKIFINSPEFIALSEVVAFMIERNKDNE